MLKAAFCDDNGSDLNELCKFLKRYCAERGQKIVYTAFQSSLNLLAEIERGIRFDILFLDILMPGENGIDVAKEIRQYDRNVKIIFLSSSVEFAAESYMVNAYFYQLKPVCAESFFHLMDSVMAACEKERRESFILRCKNGITRVKPMELEYCEVIHRTLYIHLKNGTILESIGSLDELSRNLISYGCFFRPHRSYLVNLEYIQNLSYRSITMSCMAEIPIPRGKYKEMKNVFLEYAFRNKQVMI